MSIRVPCACGRRLRARDEWAGRWGLCPNCGRKFRVPGLPGVGASVWADLSASSPTPATRGPAVSPPYTPPVAAGPGRMWPWVVAFTAFNFGFLITVVLILDQRIPAPVTLPREEQTTSAKPPEPAIKPLPTEPPEPVKDPEPPSPVPPPAPPTKPAPSPPPTAEPAPPDKGPDRKSPPSEEPARPAHPEQQPAEERRPPGNSHRQVALEDFRSADWPARRSWTIKTYFSLARERFRSMLHIDNPTGTAHKVGVRSYSLFQDFVVQGNSERTLRLPQGRYLLYFMNADEPNKVYSGDDLDIFNERIVTITLSRTGQGNYPMRRITKE